MRARFQAHWRLKLLLTVVVNLVFWTGYELLGRHAFFPLRTPPLTWFDRAIPYQPVPWAWVYVSQFLITAVLPWLIVDRETIKRYVVGLAVLTGPSFLVFALFPVASPREPLASASGAMSFVIGYDGALNAFPSLHAGFLVYMIGLLRQLVRPLRPMFWTTIVIWGGAILYATIATRQHYAMDLVAGALVGGWASWVAWRDSSKSSAVSTIARSNAVASHVGCK